MTRHWACLRWDAWQGSPGNMARKGKRAQEVRGWWILGVVSSVREYLCAFVFVHTSKCLCASFSWIWVYWKQNCYSFPMGNDCLTIVFLITLVFVCVFQDQRLKEISIHTPPSASPSSQSIGSANNNHITHTPELFTSTLSANRCAHTNTPVRPNIWSCSPF